MIAYKAKFRKILETVGRVVSGIGEGRKYVILYMNVIKEVLGITPYPGTLNIDVGYDISNKIRKVSPIVIPPPNNRYKPVYAYPGSVEGIYGFIVRPVATVHRWNIIEFITDLNMREKLGLKDGDIVRIIIYDCSSDSALT